MLAQGDGPPNRSHECQQVVHLICRVEHVPEAHLVHVLSRVKRHAVARQFVQDSSDYIALEFVSIPHMLQSSESGEQEVCKELVGMAVLNCFVTFFAWQHQALLEATVDCIPRATYCKPFQQLC